MNRTSTVKLFTALLLSSALMFSCNINEIKNNETKKIEAKNSKTIKSKFIKKKYNVEIHRIIESQWSPSIELNTIKKLSEDKNISLKLILHKPQKNSYTKKDHNTIRDINCMSEVLDYKSYISEWKSFLKNNTVSKEVSEKCNNYKYKENPLFGKLPETKDLVYITVNNEQMLSIPRSDKIVKHLCEKFKYRCENSNELGAENVEYFVLDDKNCKNCSANSTLRMLNDIFPGAKVKIVDYSSENGQKLFNIFKNKPFLPAFIFNNNLEKDELFNYIKPFIETVTDKYLLKTSIHNWDPVIKQHVVSEDDNVENMGS